MSIAFHSLLRILLISPVRIIWLAADTSGLRFRANIMKAFMGRLGVPSALRDWAISELAKAEPSLSSVGTRSVEQSERSRERETDRRRERTWVRMGRHKESSSSWGWWYLRVP